MKIDISEDREHTESSDDSRRQELLWETREENLIIKWKDDCFTRSDLHNLAAKRNKYLYTCFGIPTVMIPVLLGGLGGIIQCHSLSYSIIMMISALFNATLIFSILAKNKVTTVITLTYILSCLTK